MCVCVCYLAGDVIHVYGCGRGTQRGSLHTVRLAQAQPGHAYNLGKDVLDLVQELPGVCVHLLAADSSVEVRVCVCEWMCACVCEFNHSDTITYMCVHVCVCM